MSELFFVNENDVFDWTDDAQKFDSRCVARFFEKEHKTGKKATRFKERMIAVSHEMEAI